MGKILKGSAHCLVQKKICTWRSDSFRKRLARALFPASRLALRQIGQFATQPLQDPATSHMDRVTRKAQLGSHHPGGLAKDSRSPEGFPGIRSKVRPEQAQARAINSSW